MLDAINARIILWQNIIHFKKIDHFWIMQNGSAKRLPALKYAASHAARIQLARKYSIASNTGGLISSILHGIQDPYKADTKLLGHRQTHVYEFVCMNLFLACIIPIINNLFASWYLELFYFSNIFAPVSRLGTFNCVTILFL